MSIGQYEVEYIKRALEVEHLEAPDLTRCNGYGEIVEALYAAHESGGSVGVFNAWKTIKRLRPELTFIEQMGEVLIHASKLKELSKPETLLEGYPFYRWGFNILVGPSGSAKSFTALDFAGRIAQEREVIYIVGEGLSGYAGRWEAFKQHFNMGDGALYFHKEPVQFMDSASLEQFRKLMYERRPELLVIDTFARCAVGIEENSNSEVGKWIEAVDTLKRELACGVLVVHHTGKSGLTMRGASAMYAAADCVVMQNMSDGRITVRNDPDGGGKNKHSKEAEPRYLRLVTHNVGELEGAVLVPDSMVEDDLPESGLSNNQKVILKELSEFDGGLTAVDIAGLTSLPNSTLYRNLKSLVKKGVVTQEGGVYKIVPDV